VGFDGNEFTASFVAAVHAPLLRTRLARNARTAASDLLGFSPGCARVSSGGLLGRGGFGSGLSARAWFHE
jgi:hypothetical protein